MPPANDMPSASIALAVGLCLIALFLGLRQWYEQRGREIDHSPEDRAHFSRQDVRRRLGVGVMFVIALFVVIGSRIEPSVDGKANLLFVMLWIVVLALIVVLLVLALADWMATRAYARWHRKEMLQESIKAIRQEARQAASARARRDSNGSPDSPDELGPH